MPLIAPSILNSDFRYLEREISMLHKSQADWIHLDVMDGVFVDNISFGFPILEASRKISTKFHDVHLMIVNPDKYIEEFGKQGADGITIHYEATDDLDKSIELIKKAGCKVGVSVKPDTPVNVLFDYLLDIDLVLIMSVYPGFGGQSFIEDTYNKARELKAEIMRKGTPTLIQVDGGVNSNNMQQIVDSGVDVVVAGSFVFKAEDPLKVIKELKVFKPQQ